MEDAGVVTDVIVKKETFGAIGMSQVLLSPNRSSQIPTIDR